MDLSIMIQNQQFKHGEKAALRGEPRDSHVMNHDARALHDWLRGYDSVAAQQLEGAEP
ncbi:hypothetical protein E7V67_011455 [[Empedobacter] haloabium]|uniref:Uncharacterized protein n=1 Tax=[Empedobacter] haloabium TaxID=592317 RepID=A0ABZ1USI4_9BURK